MQTWLTVAPAIDELPLQGRETRRPPNGQSPPELLLHLADLLHQLFAACSFALAHCIHRGCEEKADGLINMGFAGDRLQLKLGKRLGDTDNGFQLTDSDRNGGASVGAKLRGVDLMANGHEVGRELLDGILGEPRCAFPASC